MEAPVHPFNDQPNGSYYPSLGPSPMNPAYNTPNYNGKQPAKLQKPKQDMDFDPINPFGSPNALPPINDAV